MSDGFQFLDIILLAMVAGFIALRLRNMLGRRTGFEQRPPPVGQSGTGRAETDNVVTLPDRRQAEANELIKSSVAASGLTRIQMADRTFNPIDFLDGAKGAYEMIVTAFAKGDTETLRPLLADDVYRSFAGAIQDRTEKGEQLTFTLVRIKSAEIIEAEVKDRKAEITIKFISELINATHDQNGKLIAGSTSQPEEVTDIWTFVRDVHSNDPNWILAATTAPN